jgi:hypothetical protein
LKGKVDSRRDMAIMVMKGEICAGDALIGYGKDLRGIGSELCCCGKEQGCIGTVVRSIGEGWACSELAMN